VELQQTLGISTIALIRPSHGAQLRMMYACSSVQPKWLRQLIALRARVGVGDAGVEVGLLALTVDRDALEEQVTRGPEVRLDGARDH
jgi:hypothetical protein